MVAVAVNAAGVSVAVAMMQRPSLENAHQSGLHLLSTGLKEPVRVEVKWAVLVVCLEDGNVAVTVPVVINVTLDIIIVLGTDITTHFIR